MITLDVTTFERLVRDVGGARAAEAPGPYGPATEPGGWRRRCSSALAVAAALRPREPDVTAPPPAPTRTPEVTLLSLRIDGIRTLLHRATSDATLAELRGRYLLATMLTGVLAYNLLARLELPAANCLRWSLGRALLLVPESWSSVADAHLAAASEWAAAVCAVLRPEATARRVPVEALFDERAGPLFREAVAERRSKEVERAGFPAGYETPEAEAEGMRERLESLSAAASARRTRGLPDATPSPWDLLGCGVPVLRAPPALLDRRTFEDGAAAALTTQRWVSDAAVGADHPRLRLPVRDQVRDEGDDDALGILRLDADRSLEWAIACGGRSLPALLTHFDEYERYFIDRVPALCCEFNGAVPPAEQVVVLLSIPDDIVIAGPIASLTSLAGRIADDYRSAVGGSMSHGIGRARRGSTPGDMAREALRGVVAMKHRRSAASPGHPDA